MHPISRLPIIVASLLVMVFAMAGSGRADVHAPWTVSAISGRAFITESSASDTRPLVRGEVLKAGDRIETGDDGKVVVMRGAQSVLVTANSNFEIVATESSFFTRIYQSMGTLMFEVDKRPKKHFQVDTPYLHAVVKGTTFTVNVDEGGATVHVTNGLVEVTEPVENQKILVARGYTASIGSGYGSGLMIGVDPKGGRRNHGPRIESDLGLGKLNFEQTSDGLLRNQKAQNGNRPMDAGNADFGVDRGASTGGMAKKNHGGGKSRRPDHSHKKNGKKK